MSREKQIEEMAKVLYDSVNARRGKASMCDLTTDLYNAGYRKQSDGEWEKASEYMPIYRCSICKERNLFKDGNNVFSNYCPHCGAKMDGERKEK